MKDSQPFPQNTEVHMIAYTLAKMELGTNANLHCVLALAEDIKRDLLRRSEEHTAEEWSLYIERSKEASK